MTQQAADSSSSGSGGGGQKPGKRRGRGKKALGGTAVVGIVVAVVVKVFLWGAIADMLGFGNRVECSGQGTSLQCEVQTRSSRSSRWRACWVAHVSCHNGKRLDQKNCTVLVPGNGAVMRYKPATLTAAGCDAIKSVSATRVSFKGITL